MPTLQELKNSRSKPAPGPTDPAPAAPDSAALLIIKRELLQANQNQLGHFATAGINVQAEIHNAIAIASQSPGVLATTNESFLDAVRAAIGTGLGLSGGNGFLSFNKELCTFVPGWKGLVELVLRSERGTVWTGVVRKGDDFDYQLGDRPHLTHRPGDKDDHQSITYYYAIGRIKGSETPLIEVWSVAKIIEHLNKYNSQGAGHYALKSTDAMESYGRKIPLLRVLQYMPRSQDLNNALAADAAHYAPAPTPLPDPAPAALAEDPAGAAPARPKPAARKPAAKKPAAKKAAPKKPAVKKPAAKKAAAGAAAKTFSME